MTTSACVMGQLCSKFMPGRMLVGLTRLGQENGGRRELRGSDCQRFGMLTSVVVSFGSIEVVHDVLDLRDRSVPELC